MRVLVACEFSGIVRDAFLAEGHDAWSCDLLPTESRPERHFQEDARAVIQRGHKAEPGARREPWDLLIAHPPCRYICRAGARWWGTREWKRNQMLALAFARDLIDTPWVEYVAVENPPGAIGTNIRKADQYIQPWEFGHGEVKMTGLWLKNLPLLLPTNIVSGREARIHRMPPGPNRGKERSRFYPGIARAMARQWGTARTPAARLTEGSE